MCSTIDVQLYGREEPHHQVTGRLPFGTLGPGHGFTVWLMLYTVVHYWQYQEALLRTWWVQKQQFYPPLWLGWPGRRPGCWPGCRMGPPLAARPNISYGGDLTAKQLQFLTDIGTGRLTTTGDVPNCGFGWNSNTCWACRSEHRFLTHVCDLSLSL